MGPPLPRAADYDAEGIDILVRSYQSDIAALLDVAQALSAIAEGRWNHHTTLNTTARQFAQNAMRQFDQLLPQVLPE